MREIPARRIKAAADYEKQVSDFGNKALDKIEDEVKRQSLREEFEGGLAKIDPLPVVENRHVAAARHDRADKDAERAALIAGGPQQTGSRTDSREFGD